MASKSKVSVRFILSHFSMDVDDVSKQLEVKPSRVRVKGEKGPHSDLRQKFNLWILESNLKDEFDAEKQILQLLKKLKRYLSTKDHLGKHESGISCVVYFSVGDSSPIISFSQRTIKLLSDYGIGIDVDYYILSNK